MQQNIPNQPLAATYPTTTPQTETDVNTVQQFSVGEATVSMVHAMSMPPTYLTSRTSTNVPVEGPEIIHIQQATNAAAYTESVAKQLSEGAYYRKLCCIA